MLFGFGEEVVGRAPTGPKDRKWEVPSMSAPSTVMHDPQSTAPALMAWIQNPKLTAKECARFLRCKPELETTLLLKTVVC